MALGVTLNASYSYQDLVSTDPQTVAIEDFFAAISAGQYIRQKQSIGTSEEAIVLGEITTPGWAMFINRDSTNFIELRVATGGAKFAKLKAGEFALLRLGSGAQVPYAIADTAACVLEYLIAIT